jgi:hypothetical protein
MRNRALWVLLLIGLVLPGVGQSSASGHAGSVSLPSFARDIAPILFRHCTECHRMGGSAPFALQSYSDARRRARQIAEVTRSRFMPPWRAKPGFGEFADARLLTQAQIQTLQLWAAQGAPQGRSADLPPLPKFSDGWRLGKPDEGMDITRCFVLPLHLTADTWVRAVEFRPQNPRLVHHALIFPDTAHMARMLQARSSDVGYASMGGPGLIPGNALGDWMPGSLPTFLIPGVARRLKAGVDLVVMIHFHPDGRPETEQSSIGLYLSKAPPSRQFAVVPLGANRIFILPGVKNYQVRAVFTLPVDVEAVGILPHAHYVCTAIKSTATLPDGTLKPLLWIEDWDYDRPDRYRYSHPIDLPAGTRITAEFTYDNSADNPRNPNSPPRFVMWGAQTMDEMAGLWLQVVLKHPADRERLARAISESAFALARSGHDSDHARGKNRFREWQEHHHVYADEAPHPDLGERPPRHEW